MAEESEEATGTAGRGGRLDGKVAIVTGAARGQGAAEANLFAAEGATVVLTDVLSTEGQATAEACGGTFHHHDVSNEEAWQRVVDETVAAHGRIDVLVNNAGIFHRAKLVDHSLDDFRRILDINTIGVFLGMKAVAPTMIEQGSGSIVNISSIAGLVGITGGHRLRGVEVRGDRDDQDRSGRAGPPRGSGSTRSTPASSRPT